jgi:hypothetical protein
MVVDSRQRRWPGNPRLAEVAAGVLMWLATTTKTVRKVDVDGVLALLDTKHSNTVRYAAAALWCLVRPRVHWRVCGVYDTAVQRVSWPCRPVAVAAEVKRLG